MRMAAVCGLALVLVSALPGCRDGSPGANFNLSTNSGTLIQSPPLRVVSLNQTDLTAQLSSNPLGQQLIASVGTPSCGVDIHYIQYRTTGGAGEPTNASGAMMVPTGGSTCTGGRPIVLYAHGTATTHGFNLANIADPTNEAWPETVLMAAIFAAQGYVVVAPNYAGYDSSALSYHPYLNGAQQAQEMQDALAAARTALPLVPAGAATHDGGKLFITGYSQGGYVAMATYRAMVAAGLSVTAAAPLSGPYNLEAFGDAIVNGNPNLGATVFVPMMIESYQHEYNGALYASLTDVFTPTYATGIDKLLPSNLTLDQLFAGNLLPPLAIFDVNTPSAATVTTTLTALGVPSATAQAEAPSIAAALAAPSAASNPVGALGFGSPWLLNDKVRILYAADAGSNMDGLFTSPATAMPAAQAPSISAFRRSLWLNDLRVTQTAGFAAATTPGTPWVPLVTGASPPNLLMCGGHSDPTVYYAPNTTALAGLWAGAAAAGLPAGARLALAGNPVDVDPGLNLVALGNYVGGNAAVLGDLATGATAATLAGHVMAAAAAGIEAQFPGLRTSTLPANAVPAGFLNAVLGVLPTGTAGPGDNAATVAARVAAAQQQAALSGAGPVDAAVSAVSNIGVSAQGMQVLLSTVQAGDAALAPPRSGANLIGDEATAIGKLIGSIVLRDYHASIVAPVCTTAARGFFANY